MERLSKGIGGDIDLTRDRAFRNGAVPDIAPAEYKPGVLPWSPSGKIYAKPQFNPYTQESWITISDFDTIVCSPAFEEIDDDYFREFIDGNQYIKDDIITKIKSTPDPQLIGLLNLDSLAVKHGRLYFSSMLSTNGYLMYYYGRTRSTANFTSTLHYGDEFYAPTMTLNTTLPSIDHIVVNGIDITPTAFGSVTLTNAEVDGEVLVLGSGEELRQKIGLRNYIVEVQRIIDEHQPRNTRVRCSECGRKFIRFRGEPGDRCPECACRLALTLGLHDESSEDINWRFRNRDERWRDFHGSPTAPHPRTFRTFDEIDAGDYFVQPVYRDRGVNLLRRPANSHELRVDLDRREFLDEEDDPVRVNSYLTTDKSFLTGGHPRDSMLETMRMFAGLAGVEHGTIPVARAIRDDAL